MESVTENLDQVALEKETLLDSGELQAEAGLSRHHKEQRALRNRRPSFQLLFAHIANAILLGILLWMYLTRSKGWAPAVFCRHFQPYRAVTRHRG